MLNSIEERTGCIQIFLHRNYKKRKLIHLTKKVAGLFQPVMAVKNVEEVDQKTTNYDGDYKLGFFHW